MANSFGRTRLTEFWASHEKRIRRSIWYSTEFTPRTGTACSEIRDRAAQNGMDLDVEHRILLPDGVIRYLHVVAHAGEDRSGNREYIGIVSDITERKRAEEERQALSRDLKESNARLEEAQRVAHVGYWEWDLETSRWSSGRTRPIASMGLSRRKRPMDLAMIREMVHPEDREVCFRQRREWRFDAGVHPVDWNIGLFAPSGEVRTVTRSPRRFEERCGIGARAYGNARRLFGTVQDITERKRAEEERQALFTRIAGKQSLARRSPTRCPRRLLGMGS